MQMRPISDDYAVSAQIQPEDVAEIAKAGYRTIICNRPDDEDPGQPSHGSIEAAARAAGLGFRFIPVISGAMTEDDVIAQKAALDEVPGPVFAYCRSGTRSANLYMGARQRG